MSVNLSRIVSHTYRSPYKKLQNSIGTIGADAITRAEVENMISASGTRGQGSGSTVSLANYYTKVEIDNIINKVGAGSGGGSGSGDNPGDLSNYYDKEWIDSSYNNISTSLNDLISADQTINNSITSINNRIDTLELAIESGSGSGGGHNYMQIIVMTEADYSALETVDRTKIYMLY